jgi:Protein of unknown function (DUF4238)
MSDDAGAPAGQSDPDRPAIVLDRASYPVVNKGHIVPRMYQRAFAVDDKVAVHVGDRPNCVAMSTKTSGTRVRYYRRVRPDGEEIDDVEASLAYVEDKATQPLRELIAGEPLTVERKGTLAQFLAVQMLRGPAFFEHREQLLLPIIEGMEAKDFTPEGLAAAGGDVEVARKRVKEQIFGPTERTRSMLTRSAKLGTVLGYMCWYTVRFASPVLAYSDQPVVMWPIDVASTPAIEKQQFGPLSALEVRVPLAADTALLMNWVDRSDPIDVALETPAAAEFNALTVAQADREWMHRPGGEPEIAEGPLRPLSRLVQPAYDRSVVLASVRRAGAEQFIARVRDREFVKTVEVLTDLGPT